MKEARDCKVTVILEVLESVFLIERRLEMNW